MLHASSQHHTAIQPDQLDRTSRESDRFAAIRDTGILEATGEPALERLARLAADVLAVRCALITVVADDHQALTGHAGLAEPWATYGQTPLSHSVCRHVVELDAPVLITDSAENSLAGGYVVDELDVRAYAGVPLRLPDGTVLGAVCALHPEPRRWTPHDVRVLEDFAALAAETIELRRARRDRGGRDPLTGLPSRAVFDHLVTEALARAQASSAMTAVVALDVCDLGLVNAALGAGAADQVLRTVARRLVDTLRADDTVCRIDGDRFLVLCTDVRDEADALRIAERLRRHTVDEPVDADGEPLPIAMRLAVATADVALSADDLVHAAVAALASTDGADTAVERGIPGLRARAGARLRLRTDLDGAHRRGEMHLVYQPIVDLATGTVRGAEALLRWRHPQLGDVSPADFIPAAETSGAITALGAWTLDLACAELAGWRSHHPGRKLSVSVNVAPVQLRTASFATLVEATLERHRVPPAALTLEITERTILDQSGPQHHTLAALRKLGVRLALDDFGTGYSALGYLSRVPVDTLKIDRSFVCGLPDDRRSAALVDGILAIAHGLGIATVAEGIETPEQRNALVERCCIRGQGYLFARPLAPAAFAAHLAAVTCP